MSRLTDAMEDLPNVLTAAQLRALGGIRRQSRRRGMAEEYVDELLQAKKRLSEHKGPKKGHRRGFDPNGLDNQCPNERRMKGHT